MALSIPDSPRSIGPERVASMAEGHARRRFFIPRPHCKCHRCAVAVTPFRFGGSSETGFRKLAPPNLSVKTWQCHFHHSPKLLENKDVNLAQAAWGRP